MHRSQRISRLTVHVHDAALCYSTPFALNNDCQLKWGPGLHTPWAMNTTSLGHIFTGSLINAMPFLFFFLVLFLVQHFCVDATSGVV